MNDTVFPPRDEWDIAAYPMDEVIEGYLECRPDDPEPGPNRSHGYRWGWANRVKDRAGIPDGFEGIRADYIHLTRHPQ